MPNRLARSLRSNLTEAEKSLWRRLRRRALDGHRFRRQQPIGPFVVDFFCPEAKLIIEVDGGQHNEPGKLDRDAERTAWLESKGYRVVRFWNHDVLNEIDGVLDTIRQALFEAGIPPSPSLPLKGGGGLSS